MKKDIQLSNKYRVTLLEYNGISGPLVKDDDGFHRWEFEDTPEIREILGSFDKDQQINLKCFVDHLRKIEGQLRNARLEGKKGEREWNRQQER